MLRAIADLDPHDGKVFLGEIESNDVNPALWRRQVGFLPAESQWWFETVGEHFANADDLLLNALGFAREVLDYQIVHLSSGERQRLALARLLTNNPMALLLDEPTASLDPENIGRVEQLIVNYRARHHCPVIWVSHDPGQIKRMADRHYEMLKGRLMEKQ